MTDSHAHLDFSQFDQDRGEVIRRAFSSGVKKIINVGCNLERAKAAVELAEKYENIYAAVGVHPTDIKEEIKNHSPAGESKIKKNSENPEFRIPNPEMDKKNVIQQIKEIAKHPRVVAIGEIGLDYFHIESDGYNVETRHCLVLKKQQKQFFIAQLELALELNLPVIIHCRPASAKASAGKDAYEDVLEILQRRNVETRHCLVSMGLRGVIHCFSGNREQARQFLDFGFYISFTGNITYLKKSDAEILQVVRDVPLEKILIETDCPFLAPIPHRGMRNEPAFVKCVAEKIAEVKGISFGEVERMTDGNAERLFGI